MTKKLTDMIEPEGWVFYAADFSHMPGRVTLMRDKANTAKWHKLSDDEKEITELFVTASGRTLIEALERACKIAAIFPPIKRAER